MNGLHGQRVLNHVPKRVISLELECVLELRMEERDVQVSKVRQDNVAENVHMNGHNGPAVVLLAVLELKHVIGNGLTV